MAKAKRTTHRSSAGKKLYAVRDSEGKFEDIQSYARAHRADLGKVSAGESEAAEKKKAAMKRKKKAKSTKAAKKRTTKKKSKAAKKRSAKKKA